MRNKNIFILLLCCLFALLLITSCGEKDSQSDPLPTEKDNMDSETNADVEKPLTTEEELAAWIENSKSLFLAQTRKLDDKQYVLVTYGKKEAAGYEVKITGTEVKNDVVEVHVKFIEPTTDPVDNDITDYPYAVTEIEKTDLPLTYIASGAERYVPSLKGIDYLRPIAAKSDEIIVFSPTSADSVNHKFTVEGIANLDEGNILYKLIDEDGKVLVIGYAAACGGDWQYFTFAVEVDKKIQLSETLTLELFTESAKDSTAQNKIEIPLQVAQKD